MGSRWVDFRRVCILQAKDMAGKLHTHHLHSQTQPEIGDLVALQYFAVMILPIHPLSQTLLGPNIRHIQQLLFQSSPLLRLCPIQIGGFPGRLDSAIAACCRDSKTDL